jgi:hypothetical protein
MRSNQSKGVKTKKKKAFSIPPTSPSPKRQKLPAVLPAGLSSIGTLKQLFSIQATTAIIEDTELSTAFPASFKAAARILDTQVTSIVPPPVSFETELESRFSTFRLAEQKAIDLLGPPQVTAFCDKDTPSQCKKVLNCKPFELYLMHGQSLFLLCPGGGDGAMAVFCKDYGKRDWKKVLPPTKVIPLLYYVFL